MELSCESVRYPEDRRPASCKFVELHVLYVPDDQWDVKLNKIPAEAIERFISAGFIRIYPDVTLKTLRSELGALLGADRSTEKFSFLKCVGRSLALVKSKQESDLKVKTFAPPYAPQPELYLLPAVESDSSVCSQSLTPDTGSSSPDHQTYFHPTKTCSLSAGTKEPVKFPLIPKCSHQPPPTFQEEGEEEEEEEEEDEEQNFSSSEAEREHEEEGLSSNKFEWAEQEISPRQPQNQRVTQSVSQKKALSLLHAVPAVLQQREADLAQVKELPEKEESYRKKEEVRDLGFFFAGRRGKTKESIKNKATNRVAENPAVLSRPVRCISPCSGHHAETVTQKAVAPSVYHTDREELIEEIKQVRDQRKQLEWTRQELLRKGKDLLSQNRHQRNQARDSWKKKYFETKKATAPLEENLRNMRQQLETFYNQLLHQLQARDNRGKPRRQGRPSAKNELIIQIMTESHEIDNLKRKIEDAKMKLVTEIKLRRQAATELRALKAELAQKKSQSSGSVAPQAFGNSTRDRPQVQHTSI